MRATGSRQLQAATAGRPVPPWLPFVVAGAVSILAGGFVAAAGGEAPSKHLSWACAYLVLVCGSAQIFLGGGRGLLARRPPPARLAAWQLATFNLGNASVLAGTLLAVPAVLAGGSVLLLAALALFAWDARGANVCRGARLAAYRLGILALASSVPVGVVLGH